MCVGIKKKNIQDIEYSNVLQNEANLCRERIEEKKNIFALRALERESSICNIGLVTCSQQYNNRSKKNVICIMQSKVDADFVAN